MYVKRHARNNMTRNIRLAAKAETSKALIRSARRHFFEYGYSAASMEAICEDADVTRGALYHNFGGKAGLFEAVVRQINAEVGDRILESVEEERLTLDSFTQACMTYLRLASEPETQKIMFREAPVVLGQKLRDLDAEGSLGPLQEALEGLIDDGLVVALDAVALARLLNGAMIEGALLIAESENGDEVLAQVSHALESVIFGLKAGSA